MAISAVFEHIIVALIFFMTSAISLFHLRVDIAKEVLEDGYIRDYLQEENVTGVMSFYTTIFNFIVVIYALLWLIFLFYVIKNKELADKNPKKLLSLLKKEQIALIIFIVIPIVFLLRLVLFA